MDGWMIRVYGILSMQAERRQQPYHA